MKINEWLGPYQLTYKRNDPMRGEVWTFQRNGVCIEVKPSEATGEALDRAFNGN